MAGEKVSSSDFLALAQVYFASTEHPGRVVRSAQTTVVRAVTVKRLGRAMKAPKQ
jgi:hypothetical protein